jgi:sugar O-acyltransferase (sialic acid O-acetyltransferase NeuD family)
VNRDSRKVLIYGAGGHGKVVADAALSAGFGVVGFADDDVARRGKYLLGLEVRATGLDGAVRLCRSEGAGYVVAIGANAARKCVFDSLRQSGLDPLTIVHPSARVASSARLGAGTVVFACAVVNVDATVGENGIINTAASVDHDCVLGPHTHISPGAHLGGMVLVGEGTHIGIGSSVRNNVSIGPWSTIGVGAVVIGDVPERVVAFGVPARVQHDL